MALQKAWEWEKKNHLGDYGDSTENEIKCAFQAGWGAAQKHYKKLYSQK